MNLKSEIFVSALINDLNCESTILGRENRRYKKHSIHSQIDSQYQEDATFGVDEVEKVLQLN